VRINIVGLDTDVSAELKAFAESRVRRVARRSPWRIVWAGVRLLLDDDGGDGGGGRSRADGGRPVGCRVDAWVRDLGHFEARHADANAFVAVDVSVAQLEREIARAGGALPRHRRDDAMGDAERVGPADGTAFLDYDPVTPHWPDERSYVTVAEGQSGGKA
jgi:hypothetical protein